MLDSQTFVSFTCRQKRYLNLNLLFSNPDYSKSVQVATQYVSKWTDIESCPIESGTTERPKFNIFGSRMDEIYNIRIF